MKDQADGQERHAAGAAHGTLGSEGQARGARPQRHQDRLRLRRALGKNQDDAARAERRDRRGEHLVVPPWIVPGFCPSVDGHCAHQAQRRADQRVAKERRLGEHRDGARHGRDDQHRVDQRVVVVSGDDHTTALGNVLPPDHLDPPVEEPQEETGQCADDPIGQSPERRAGRRRADWRCSRGRGRHAYARVQPIRNLSIAGQTFEACLDRRRSVELPCRP